MSHYKIKLKINKFEDFVSVLFIRIQINNKANAVQEIKLLPQCSRDLSSSTALRSVGNTCHIIYILYYIILLEPGQLSWYGDSLRAGGSGDRIPLVPRYSTPIQTAPGAHPASYTMGTGSFPGIKQTGRGADHPPPSSAEVEGRVELCF